MFGFENMLHNEFTELPFKIMIYTIVFLVGICIGSFLNVVIIRLPMEKPEDRSLTKKSSHCMSCGTPIRPIDLIPVFSWLFLRGKCHSCGAKISARYPLVESLNGLLYVLTFAVLDINAKAIITCVLMSLLIVVGFMDWDTKEIDMVIVGMIFLLAIPSAIFEEDFNIGSHILGAMVVSVPFFIIGELSRFYIRKKYGEDFRGIELGDTILMIAAGALLGTQAVIVSALLGIILCALIGIIHFIVTKEKVVAFGPGLAIGIAVSALWGNQIAEWYLGMLVVEETIA